MQKGCLQVYTGNGKGKTTAAMGLALRALGAGLRVAVIHFMKFDLEKGERKLTQLFPDLVIESFGTSHFVDKKNPDRENVDAAKTGMKFAKELVTAGKYDLLILDELCVALDFGLVKWKEIKDFLKNKPVELEIVMTGRRVSKEVLGIADLVTEMHEVKHYFKDGVKAREGIEY